MLVNSIISLEGFGTELNIVDYNITHENTTSCKLIAIKNNFYSTILNNLLPKLRKADLCAPVHCVIVERCCQRISPPPFLIVNEKSPFDQDFNPCKFWKPIQLRFLALLAPITGNIICIHCSSANIKRLCV